MLNKLNRLYWAREHECWTVQDWLRVIWTDESAFYIGGFRERVWVTRNAEEEYHEQCLVPKFQRLTHIMVWGAICADRIGPLVIWDKEWGNITSKAYVEHITDPVLAPFYQRQLIHSFPYPTYVMQDGAPANRAKNTQDAEKKHGITRLEWPPSSPDLNPIETIWRIMKDKLEDSPVRPSTIPDMIQLLESLWNNLDPHVDILPHIISLPTRIKAVIEARGGHTKY